MHDYTCVSVLCVGVNFSVFVCIWLHGTMIQTHLVRSRPVKAYTNLCPIWIWYIDNSNADPLDDSKNHIDSCNEGQMTIRIHKYFTWVFALVQFSYLPLLLDTCAFFVLFHVIVWYTLLVWLPISSHVMKVSTHFICTVDSSVYLRQFM